MTVPPGYAMTWSGQYENMLRVRERLKLILPITLVLIFALLYMNTCGPPTAGADVMKRIAAPMVGGLVTSFALELLVYPAVYFLWKRKGLAEGPPSAEPLVGHDERLTALA